MSPVQGGAGNSTQGRYVSANEASLSLFQGSGVEHIRPHLRPGRGERGAEKGDARLAPKAKKGKSPLWEALQIATPALRDSDFAMYFASAFGISVERFAYFVLSLVWRAAAHDWPLPDGTRSVRLDLGEYYEPVRRYLLGDTGFPEHTYLTMALCTDEKPQDYWMPPQRSEELPGLIVVPLFGTLFRVWFGRVIPKPIETQLFYPDQANRIFTTHCWDVLGASFDGMFPPESV